MTLVLKIDTDNEKLILQPVNTSERALVFQIEWLLNKRYKEVAVYRDEYKELVIPLDKPLAK